VRTSVPLGKAFGVPVFLHFSSIVIIALFMYILAYQDIPVAGLPVGFGNMHVSLAVKLVLGLVVAVLFIASVLLHELAHSWLAVSMGYKVAGITIFIFGGVSQMEEMPKDPKQELKVAFVGPATSLALGVAFLGGFLAMGSAPPGTAFEAISISLGTLAFYNLVLGVFNLVPAFPTDGGRVLRAGLAMRMSMREATRIAAGVGKAMAIGMAVLGLLTFNLWFILIAAFIYMGGSQEEQGTLVSLALEHHHVSEVMLPNVDTVPPTMTLAELYAFMWAHRQLGYPVIDGGNLVGLVTFDHLRGIGQDQLPTVRVGDVMQRQVLTAAPLDDAMEAFKRLVRGPGDMLVVMDAGRVVGTVTQADFMRAVKLAGG